MFNVQTSYLDDVVDQDSLTKHSYLTYYDGQDLIVAGRLQEGTNSLTITSRVTGTVAGGDFDVETSAPVEQTFDREIENYAERGWKFLTLTNQIEVRNLQTTSPIQDGPDVLELAETFEFVLDESRFPPQVIRGRGDTAAGDPHIVIQDPRSDLRICFDIHGPQGTVVSLVEDPALELAVNGEMVEKGNITNSNRKKPPPTFFGRIGILLGNDWISVSREHVMVNSDLPFNWFRNTVVEVASCKLRIVSIKVIKISCPNGVIMKILRHRVSHGDYDHFDFFLGKGQVFSSSVDGIIGQFQRRQMSLVKSSIRKTRYGKEKGVLLLDEKEIKVTKITRRRIGSCWASYAKMGLPMLERGYEDYILPRLTSKRV
ncbi:Inter-alpha-trypsin inhibitor heavy chain H3 [Holothuria leucospilota]|uniref:Inter-alpha-trypsin inhibitor heavy chain H3 n=1 Tax=Holothuria leucospilota TaxID=206669 RepID=A0A9Q1CJR5_HOLLE|nr:Inter-alpha-trypsin inhibitor heavy chain H3 [Holothuria leucospilota]